MAAKRYLVRVLSIGLILALAGGAGLGMAQGPPPQTETFPQAALGAGFTYQGQLESGDEPVTGDCEMAFRLYDGAAGDQVGQAITATVPITDGLFAVTLDFGSDAFAGEARWLGIRVKCAGDSDYADLGLQALTAAPYALYALGAPWSGLDGVPAGLDDGDDDTTYTAGDGLTLAATEFSADTSYLQRRVGGDCAVGSTIRAINADGTVVCQSDQDTTYSAADGLALTGTEFGADTSYLQRRVGGDCTVGSTIRAINADGTVVCQSDAPLNRSIAPRANLITTLDSEGDVGEYSSATIGSDGLGLISYYDRTNDDLKVAHCNDLACTTATLTTLDSEGTVGWCTSVTIGADGLGLISYSDYTNYDLKVAHCNDLACTSATTTTLDSTGDVGYYTSVTIGSDGLGLISYSDFTNDDLKVAHCNDPACTTAISTTLDSAGSVGRYTSVTIGSDGLGLISYYDWANGDLKVAHCDDLACTGATVTTLDSAGDVGVFTSVTIGSDGLGLISYCDWTNEDLKVAQCNDLACTSVISTTLDNEGYVGEYTSVTIGSDGLGLISYWHPDNGDLKVAHCANPFCVPYFRRR